MTTRIKIAAFACLIAGFFLSGCETVNTAASQPAETSRTFTASKNALWPLLLQEVAGNYPIKVLEKESGLFTTEFVSMPAGFNNGNMNQWVVPPKVFLGTWNGLRMNMSVLVTEPSQGTTHVAIRTHYEAFENNVSHAWVVCQSNGSLENEILSRVAQQLPK